MTGLRHFLRAWQSEDRGQDLAEYCLLTALVALVALAFIIHASGGMQALWSGANTSLTAGNASVSTTTSGGDATASAPAH
jgi:Flp pilus assembly pilin Flp